MNGMSCGRPCRERLVRVASWEEIERRVLVWLRREFCRVMPGWEAPPM